MNSTQLALRIKYAHLHPLIFQRSLEKARNDIELFDILDSFPENYPVIWDEEQRVWKTTDNLLQSLEKQ